TYTKVILMAIARHHFASSFLILTLAIPTAFAQPSTDPADLAMESIRPEAIRADMRFLSDDQLEGRGTATRGHEIAAKFMAAEFESMGLTPAGDAATYFQKVPLRSVVADESNSSMSIIRNGKTQKLVFRKDFISVGDPNRKETSVEAPVVYV